MYHGRDKAVTGRLSNGQNHVHSHMDMWLRKQTHRAQCLIVAEQIMNSQIFLQKLKRQASQRRRVVLSTFITHTVCIIATHTSQRLGVTGP